METNEKPSWSNCNWKASRFYSPKKTLLPLFLPILSVSSCHMNKKIKFELFHITFCFILAERKISDKNKNIYSKVHTPCCLIVIREAFNMKTFHCWKVWIEIDRKRPCNKFCVHKVLTLMMTTTVVLAALSVVTKNTPFSSFSVKFGKKSFTKWFWT